MPLNEKLPPPLVEPSYIRDVLVSGIADIELLGGCVARITFFVDSKPLCQSAPTDRLVADRVAIPISAMPQIVQQMVTFMAEHHLADVVELVPALAH